jgi:hypothetical protein
MPEKENNRVRSTLGRTGAFEVARGIAAQECPAADAIAVPLRNFRFRRPSPVVTNSHGFAIVLKLSDADLPFPGIALRLKDDPANE